MSNLTGNQERTVFLKGKVAQSVGDYFALLGRYDEAREEYLEAIAAYDQALTLDPNLVQADSYKEIVLSNLGNLQVKSHQSKLIKGQPAHQILPQAPTVEDSVLRTEELPLAEPTSSFKSGVFTVGETGEVSIDYLFDGGGYQGELAIFSLDGMDEFKPGSEEFIKEAARRALSDSELGHVVISDSINGARFSANLTAKANLNTGTYQGVKTFFMTPQDEFCLMLVPNGRVHDILNSGTISDAKRPLFSLEARNPDETFHLEEIADVTGNSSTFVIEDLQADISLDRAYNDVIFRLTGATGKATLVDELVTSSQDLRGSDLGDALIAYVKTRFILDLITTPSGVADPVLPEISKVNQPLIGVIHTGLSANNPDTNYSQSVLGRDLVTGEDNPLEQSSEGSEPDTDIVGIIGGTQNNDIDIGSITDNMPLWVGRAVSSGQWADSLVEFVEEAKASSQPNAVGNLNVDLSQINPDGSVTKRYEFTSEERAALEYALQNKVLIIVLDVGTDGGVISALNQVLQKFDNIITVGTLKNSARVTVAFSQVWAANPNLSYHQVSEILKSTATALSEPNWNAEKGLVNIVRAVNLARATESEESD